MAQSPAEPKVELRISVKSLKKSRSTPRLIELIQENQEELLTVLAESDAEVSVKTVEVERDEAFGTGLEVLGILFLIGLGKGFVEGTGEGMGKEAGKKFGEAVSRWIERKFGDVEFGDVEIVTLGLSDPS